MNKFLKIVHRLDGGPAEAASPVGHPPHQNIGQDDESVQQGILSIIKKRIFLYSVWYLKSHISFFRQSDADKVFPRVRIWIQLNSPRIRNLAETRLLFIFDNEIHNW